MCSRSSLKFVKEFLRFSLAQPGHWDDNNTKNHEEWPKKSPLETDSDRNRRLIVTDIGRNQRPIATTRRRSQRLIATNRPEFVTLPRLGLETLNLIGCCALEWRDPSGLLKEFGLGGPAPEESQPKSKGKKIPSQDLCVMMGSHCIGMTCRQTRLQGDRCTLRATPVLHESPDSSKYSLVKVSVSYDRRKHRKTTIFLTLRLQKNVRNPNHQPLLFEKYRYTTSIVLPQAFEMYYRAFDAPELSIDLPPAFPVSLVWCNPKYGCRGLVAVSFALIATIA